MVRSRDPIVIERQSSVSWSADAVWDILANLANVNSELMPLVFMRVPRGTDVDGLTQSDVGRPLFVSWLFVFGLIPFDRHVVGKIEGLVERGFDECSYSMFHAVWRHQRRVLVDGEGSIIRDKVEIVPRFAALGSLTGWIARQVFSHRHDRLKALFGAR